MARGELPADVIEAFDFDASTPLEMTAKDLEFFKGCVDKSGSNWKVPPPSPRHLRLIRRLELTTKKWANGKVGDSLVALIDVSQLPPEWCAAIDEHGISIPILVHTSNLLKDVLDRMKIEISSTFAVGSLLEYSISKRSVAKAKRLVDAHQVFIGEGPSFLTEIHPTWRPYAKHGIEKFGE